jgi:hypothetical protein
MARADIQMPMPQGLWLTRRRQRASGHVRSLGFRPQIEFAGWIQEDALADRTLASNFVFVLLGRFRRAAGSESVITRFDALVWKIEMGYKYRSGFEARRV